MCVLRETEREGRRVKRKVRPHLLPCPPALPRSGVVGIRHNDLNDLGNFSLSRGG